MTDVFLSYLILFMVMNSIKTVMFVLWTDYVSFKLNYVMHILIMDIMVIFDDYGTHGYEFY